MHQGALLCRRGVAGGLPESSPGTTRGCSTGGACWKGAGGNIRRSPRGAAECPRRKRQLRQAQEPPST